MASKTNSQPGHTVHGPNADIGAHGMKGIIGKNRARTYEPSSYERGDTGGAAGGYGLHGASGEGGVLSPGSPGVYGGQPLRAGMGGVRGGGVSEQETMPSSAIHPPKVGYDEHRSVAPSTVHGVPGVEGMVAGGESGPPSSRRGQEDHGYSCPHGCGTSAKSRHGLARHVHARHGGFGGLGHAFGEKHGSSYKKGEEFRGETEYPEMWAKNEHEWKVAEDEIQDAPHNQVNSSYDK